MTTIATRSMLEKMHDGQAVFGLTTRVVRGAEAVRVARASGHDFVRIDTQHSLVDLESIGRSALAGLAETFPTIVRVRELNDPNVGVILDSGIGGVIFPNIDDADQAARAVELTRFAPLGKRSYGGTYPHFGYESVSVVEAMETLNVSTLLACMIESTQALDDIEHIAAVPGIDVLHLGMSDLLISAGRPGRYDDPLIAEALYRIGEVARANGLLLGCGGAPTVEHQLMAIDHGATFLTTRADTNLIVSAGRRWLDEISEGRHSRG